MKASRTVIYCLAAVIVCLLSIGFVSGTPIRHAIQVIAPALALIFAVRKADWAGYAAVPIFALWLFVVFLIWAYLLGFSRIANGHYTAAEVLLTFGIGLSCVLGIIAVIRETGKAKWYARIVAFLLFGALQVAVLQFSLHTKWARV
jgi:hypothetical protein